jgi:hypothetical protein
MTGAVLAFDASSVLGFGPDPAVGDDAETLNEAVGTALSPDTSVWYQAAEQVLLDVIREATHTQHRGVEVETLEQAAALLAALPTGAPSPEVVLEADGQIGFDWMAARDRVLSLNVDSTGMLGYAARVGLESSYGRVPFAGTLPERIRHLLGRVLEPRSAG